MVASVVIDFDGTVTLEDTTDLLLERFADPVWRKIEEDWIAGRIGSRECLARQIDLVRATRADFEALADTVPVDPAFADFVAAGCELGLHMVIASDGFEPLISRVLARIGIKLPVRSNRLIAGAANRWRAEFPHYLGDCRSQSGNCKCALFNLRPTVMVGDGRSDFCAAPQAALVLAKKSLAMYCRDAAIEHVAIEGFADATRALRAFCKAQDRTAAATARENGALHA
ncbi:MAG TPA: HAD-IB family phosphatase [Xanthobacteraceae bacterium]|nr:HAD-IB family phosphatase [Xanthobacteraceae bacterium]